MLFKDKHLYFGLFIIVSLSFFLFFSIFYIQIWSAPSNVISDLPAHVRLIQTAQIHHYFPIYSLWYALVSLISGSSSNFNMLADISILLLTFFIVLKYVLTYSILNSTHPPKTLALFVSVSLMIVMPILSYYKLALGSKVTSISNFHFYLGNISPNQWHNSTLILAMPFNIGLFYFSTKNIRSNQLRTFLIMGILSIVSILCKPNYAIAFLPILCSSILFLNYKEKHLFIGLIKTSLIAIPSILILLLQWYFTFKHNNLFEHPVKTTFSPFLVWGLYTPHIFISLLLSIAFPLATTILYFNKIDFYLFMSWLVLIVALLIFSLLAEYPLYSYANFVWGAIAANYILFLFSARLLLQQPLDWKAKTAFSIFGLHLLSGIFFLCYVFMYKTPLII